MTTRTWDPDRQRLVPTGEPDTAHAQEWPFYCATFHLAAAWYAIHRSEELFYFLIAAEPGWPYFSTDPGNWPDWIELSTGTDKTETADPEPFDAHFATGIAWIDRWGERDTPQRRGVRVLAQAMRDLSEDAPERRAWSETVRACQADPASMGGPWSIAPPPQF